MLWTNVLYALDIIITQAVVVQVVQPNLTDERKIVQFQQWGFANDPFQLSRVFDGFNLGHCVPYFLISPKIGFDEVPVKVNYFSGKIFSFNLAVGAAAKVRK